MPETSIPTPPGFAELPKAEQVRYLQALWDEISEHPLRRFLCLRVTFNLLKNAYAVIAKALPPPGPPFKLSTACYTTAASHPAARP